MNDGKSYTASFAVDKSPRQVFDAVTNVRGWWSEDIEGRTDRLGAVFTFRSSDQHRSTHRITEFVPGKRVVWHMTASQINFVKDKDEWKGTDIVFELARRVVRPSFVSHTLARALRSSATTGAPTPGPFTS